VFSSAATGRSLRSDSRRVPLLGGLRWGTRIPRRGADPGPGAWFGRPPGDPVTGARIASRARDPADSLVAGGHRRCECVLDGSSPGRGWLDTKEAPRAPASIRTRRCFVASAGRDSSEARRRHPLAPRDPTGNPRTPSAAASSDPLRSKLSAGLSADVRAAEPAREFARHSPRESPRESARQTLAHAGARRRVGTDFRAVRRPVPGPDAALGDRSDNVRSVAPKVGS
jgi:hypothetical protein